MGRPPRLYRTAECATARNPRVARRVSSALSITQLRGTASPSASAFPPAESDRVAAGRCRRLVSIILRSLTVCTPSRSGRRTSTSDDPR
eukprot:2219974-Rhodomonas_salina.1